MCKLVEPLPISLQSRQQILKKPIKSETSHPKLFRRNQPLSLVQIQEPSLRISAPLHQWFLKRLEKLPDPIPCLIFFCRCFLERDGTMNHLHSKLQSCRGRWSVLAQWGRSWGSWTCCCTFGSSCWKLLRLFSRHKIQLTTTNTHHSDTAVVRPAFYFGTRYRLTHMTPPMCGGGVSSWGYFSGG